MCHINLLTGSNAVLKVRNNSHMVMIHNSCHNHNQRERGGGIYNVFSLSITSLLAYKPEPRTFCFLVKCVPIYQMMLAKKIGGSLEVIEW